MKRYNLNVQFASMMMIIITWFSCSKTDIDRPAILDCTLEKEIIYKTNPKSTIYQSIIDKYVKLGLPGVILLVKNDSGFYVGASGMADIKEGIKNFNKDDELILNYHQYKKDRKNIFDKNAIDEWIMQDSNKNNTNNNDFIVNKLLNIAA